MRHLALSILILAAACGGSDAQSTPDDLGIADPTPLPSQIISTSSASTSETEPSIAVAPDGTVAVAWLGVRGSTYAPGYTFSSDRGATWSSPQQAPMPDGGFAGNEIIVADAQSNFGLVSLSVKPPTSRVYYARAAPGMKAFGAWAEVSDPALERARDATAMAVASDQSSIIVWTEHVSSLNAVIVVARSADGGTTWQRSNLTAPDGSVAWPNLCASPTSGRVAVVYIDELTGETALRVSDDNGATWPATSFNTVAPQEQIGEFPSCVVNATDLWVMQGQSTETPTAQFAPTLDLIQLSHSADGGKTLDATVSVQDPSAGTRYMRAMATVDAKKRLALAYYAGAMPEDPQASVRYSYSIDSGKTFAPSVSIHSPIILTTSRATKSWLGDLLGITADAHDTFVAFAANGTGASHVGVVRIPVIAP